MINMITNWMFPNLSMPLKTLRIAKPGQTLYRFGIPVEFVGTAEVSENVELEYDRRLVLLADATLKYYVAYRSVDGLKYIQLIKELK